MSRTKLALNGPNPTVSQVAQVVSPKLLYGKNTGKKDFRKCPANSTAPNSYVVLQQQDCNKVIYVSGLTTYTHIYLPPEIQSAGDHIRIIIEDMSYVVYFRTALYVNGVIGAAQQITNIPVGGIPVTTRSNLYLDILNPCSITSNIGSNFSTFCNVIFGNLPTLAGGRAIVDFDCDGNTWWGHGHVSAMHQ